MASAGISRPWIARWKPQPQRIAHELLPPLMASRIPHMWRRLRPHVCACFSKQEPTQTLWLEAARRCLQLHLQAMQSQ